MWQSVAAVSHSPQRNYAAVILVPVLCVCLCVWLRMFNLILTLVFIATLLQCYFPPSHRPLGRVSYIFGVWVTHKNVLWTESRVWVGFRPSPILNTHSLPFPLLSLSFGCEEWARINIIQNSWREIIKWTTKIDHGAQTILLLLLLALRV